MKCLKAIVAFVLPLALSSALTSCGGDDAGVNGDLLDMAVSSSGIILPVAGQSCVDKANSAATPTVTRSLAAPSLSFARLSITWKATDVDLYAAYIKLTITSNRLTGGVQEITLDPTEIEALFGARGAILTQASRPAISGPPAYPAGYFLSTASASVKGTSTALLNLQPCGLGAGALSLADTKNTSTFSATVRIDLVGYAYSNASNVDQSIQKTVRKSVESVATFN